MNETVCKPFTWQQFNFCGISPIDPGYNNVADIPTNIIFYSTSTNKQRTFFKNCAKNFHSF